MSIEAADEAQALLHPGVRYETGRIRDGVVERSEIIHVPEAFFDTAQNAVLEQLTMAKNSTLRDYPELAANSVVNRLVTAGMLAQSDATKVRDLVELEIRRGIEHLAEDARNRYATRLPITFRSLIPLISRRSGTK